MKDIDFDELDRAVSSVLSKDTPASASVTPEGPKATPIRPDRPSPVSSEAATTEATGPVASTGLDPVAEANTPVSDLPEATPSDDLEPTPVASPVAAPITLKPRGKFMDVMHPSADMNPGVSAQDSRRPAPVSRTLAPLTPRQDTVPEPSPAEPKATVDESTSLIGAEPTPSLDPVVPPKSEESPEEHLLLTATTEDKLEEAEKSPEDTSSSFTASYVDPLDVPLSAVKPAAANDTASATSQQAQPTPFLSDTKVDKRPLGGFVSTDEKQEDTSQEKPPVAEVDVQTAPEVPLPRELQPDVVGVESVQEGDVAAQSDSQPSAPFATSVPAATDVSDGRVEGHPLFDTSTYHEPIAAVPGKKIAPWIIWSVGLGICLVIGSGVGYFLFRVGL